MMCRRRNLLCTLSLVLMLAGCAQPERVPDAAAPATLPEALYLEAARAGAEVYRVQAADSRLLLRVGRSGTLKGLGHDHAISSTAIEGLVMLTDNASAARADLLVPLISLTVDRPEDRTQLGLEEPVSASAIEGTTANMQDKVLESDRFPVALIRARLISAPTEPNRLGVSVTLHGATAEYIVPVNLQVAPDELRVQGKMTLRHADFGLSPYSAAGGLLKVAEEIELQFELLAKRI
jgi:hypothetical protein